MSRRNTAEVAVVRYLDEDVWDYTTNDTITAKTLLRRGWEPSTRPEAEDGYWVFKLPLKAVLIRSARAVQGFKANKGRPDNLVDGRTSVEAKHA